jgi:type IV pilus assembly protein PilY1
MNLLRHACLILASLLALAAAPAHAAFDPVGEDIDIFLANPSFTAERPNVLVFLDNTSNWGANAGGSTKFAVEKTALTTVVTGLSNGLNVGMMLFPETGNPNDNANGGYVRYAVRQMTDDNKSALLSVINNLDRTGDQGSSSNSSSLGMYEVFSYFAGITAPGGSGKVKRDCPGNTAYNSYIASLGNNAFTSCDNTTGAGKTYVSPIINACQKNFVILISNGTTSNQSSNTAAEAALKTVSGGSPSQITLSPANDDWTDEWTKHMANADCNASFSGTQSISTYVIEVDPGSSTTALTWTAMLKSAAFQGKGRYISVSVNAGADALITALKDIFQEVQSVNSVFASTTLPVSVNVRGTNLNQVYIGVFRPDATKLPRWFGNLKLYNLKVANNELFLADSTGTQATNDQKGFISQSANSFWTKASTFWNFRDGTYADTDVGKASDSPDGDLVEKGGAAQQLRIAYLNDHTTRKVYTCTGSCPCAGNSCTVAVSLADSPFDSSNANITALGLGTMTTKTVTSLTSVGTLATATVTAHGFTSGNTVLIAGASPSLYNGTYTIAVVDANTFTYTLASSASGNTATAAATAHNLNSGDLLDITGSTQAGYNVTGAALTKVDANTFT